VKAVEEITKNEGKDAEGKDGGLGWEMFTARHRAPDRTEK
jgi:hypothetical protein